MADGQAPAVAAAFPDPPPYWKHFTKQNLIRAENIESGNDELRYLIPPAPPADGKYKSFGVQHDLAQPDISLSSAGITEIYPGSSAILDPTPRLLALTRAILLNFLELVGVMANDPTSAPAKTEDLQTLFYNVHDLINQYRPHQARESLILMMEEELGRARAMIDDVDGMKGKVEELLKTMVKTGEAQEDGINGHGDVAADGPTAAGLLPGGAVEAKRRARQRAQWEALNTAAESG